MKQIQGAWYERLGPPHEVLQVGELPAPEVGPGEVLVRILASGINPADCKRRAGWQYGPMAFPRIIPHADGAGVIVATGEGVTAKRVGQRVWLWNAQGDRPWGTAAELCALPAERAVPLPPGVDVITGATLGIPAVTAHYALHADGPIGGQTVLVQGGAGAVGYFAIQLAVAAKARVIATVSSAAKAQVARSAGAVVVDYRREDVVDAVLAATGGLGVDRVVEVDFAANQASDVRLIRPNGVIASYSSTSDPHPTLDYYALAFKGVTLRLVQAYLLPPKARAAAIEAINAALSTGTLHPPPVTTFPLKDIAAAHGAVEGKTLVGKAICLL
ncbi:MAG: NADPH:quinone reductase [Candidatus Competibacterales bacterium]